MLFVGGARFVLLEEAQMRESEKQCDAKMLI